MARFRRPQFSSSSICSYRAVLPTWLESTQPEHQGSKVRHITPLCSSKKRQKPPRNGSIITYNLVVQAVESEVEGAISIW